MKLKFFNYAFALVLLTLSFFISAMNYGTNRRVQDKEKTDDQVKINDVVVKNYAEFDAIKNQCYIGVRSVPVTRANI